VSHVASVTKALNFIESNLRREITVDNIADAVHFSTSHFHALFTKVTGRTVADYVRGRRLACAALDLALSQKQIIDIAFEYRFDSQEAFTRAFRRVYGVTPGVFRRRPEYAGIVTRVGIHRTMAEVHKRVFGNSQDESARSVTQPPLSAAGRRVLPNVPRVWFYDGRSECPEDIAFPSCLAAALRYLGEDYWWAPVHQHRTDWRLNGAFVEMMAASGMAFGLLWREGWHQDNAALMFIADPREVIRRAFQYAGYRYRIIQKRGRADDEAIMRARICAALDDGRPVLAFGVIGPPECCLITGYDDGGETLLGWNYFQNDKALAADVETEPCGYFRKRDWFSRTISAITIGEKVARQDTHERNRETLRWGIEIATTPEVYGRCSGFSAYGAWADQLLCDEDFESDDVDVLKQRQQVHDVAVGNVAECRWYASMFLNEMARAEPAIAGDLQAAAREYDQEHTLMWRVWGLVGGNGNPHAHLKLAEPETRRRIAAVIREARTCDERAVMSLERALRR
jgi:AraC-like DNA-binding protein